MWVYTPIYVPIWIYMCAQERSIDAGTDRWYSTTMRHDMHHFLCRFPERLGRKYSYTPHATLHRKKMPGVSRSVPTPLGM